MSLQSALEKLNEKQKQAVTHTGSPLLIVAGAGTGKTTVLTTRIAYLLEKEALAPQRIFAATFTEKAAGEILERLELLHGGPVHDMWTGTFHSLCERVLREHGHHIGLPMGFRVQSEMENWMLVRNNLSRFTLEYFKPRGNPTKFLRALLMHFSRCKDELVTPERYAMWVQEEQLNTDTAMDGYADTMQQAHELAQAYHAYEQLLFEKGCLDFGSLLVYTHELFAKRPHILAQYRAQFAHVLVDEFQDTNVAQYAILKQLCVPQGTNTARPTITVVGDDNQSIYGFRGAAIENILTFSRDFPDATQLVLTDNYRSQQNILDVSYTLIAKNAPYTLESQLGIDKRLHAQVSGQGTIAHHLFANEQEEAAWIAAVVRARSEAGHPWRSMAVLVRAHGHASALRALFVRERIPHVQHGVSTTLDHAVVLYCVTFLRVLQNLHDSDALYTLVQHAPLALDHTTMSALTHACKRRAVSLYDALRSVGLLEVSAETVTNVERFLGALTGTHARMREHSLRDVLIRWLEESGMMEVWAREQEQGTLEEPFAALEQFFVFMTQFERVSDTQSADAFLRFYADAMLAGNDITEREIELAQDAVHIMTIHAAKGLEFDTVFLPSMVMARFPSMNRGEPIPLPRALTTYPRDEQEAHLLEERRLCYVGITRAKASLYLTAAQSYNESKTKRKPSRFLAEMNLEASEAVLKAPSEPVEAHATPATLPGMAGSVQHEPIERLSFSQLQTFLRCPLQFKYRFLLHIPTHGNHAMSFGTTIHTTLQAWYELLRERRSAKQQDLFGATAPMENDNSLPEVQELLTIYRQKWVDEWYENGEQKQEYWKHGEQILKAFYEKHNPFAVLPLLLEQSFKVDIGGCVFSGRIDRIDTVDSGIAIIDYKTGTPRERLEKEDKHQLLLYYMAARKAPALAALGPVQRMEYWYVSNGTVQEVAADAGLALAFEEEIATTVTQMRESTFEPTPDPYTCRSCDYRFICPYRKLH